MLENDTLSEPDIRQHGDTHPVGCAQQVEGLVMRCGTVTRMPDLSLIRGSEPIAPPGRLFLFRDPSMSRLSMTRFMHHTMGILASTEVHEGDPSIAALLEVTR